MNNSYVERVGHSQAAHERVQPAYAGANTRLVLRRGV